MDDIDEPLPFNERPYSTLSPLQLSVRYGLDAVLEFVLWKTSNLRDRCYNEESVLHLVCECGNSLENTRKLLEQDADIEAKDLFGKTPLMKAVEYNRPDLVRLFIEYDANLEARDNSGATALLNSIKFQRFDQFKLLLEKGASLSVIDKKMNTALHYMFNGFVKINKKLCEAILKLGLDPNARNAQNWTPLHELANSVAQGPKVKYAGMLLEYGAALNELTNKGDSVLHICARRAFTNVNMELLIYFINRGAVAANTNNRNENFLNVRFYNFNVLSGPYILKKLVIEEQTGKFNFTNELEPMISSDATLCNLLASCRKEVALLNRMKVHENSYLSLLNVFLFNNKQLARISRNELIAAALKKFDTRDFLVYEKDIRRKFKNVIDLMEAETSVFNYLNRATTMNVEEILGVLDALPSPWAEIIEPRIT